MGQHIEDLVRLAKDGDVRALAQVVASVQDDVVRLATRMLADPDAAQDAAQEILIRVVTKLSTFKGDSRFRTWVYRIATNYLLTARKVIARDPGLSFEAFGDDLLSGLVDDSVAPAEDHVMLNELRVRCTMAMLLCLDRNHRAAYVLGEILELDQTEAALALDVSPANFRKQLSRTRAKIQDFTAQSCGLANASAPCRCRRRLPAALDGGRIGSTPSAAFVDAPDHAAAKAMARSVNAQLAAAKLQRATGALKAPKDFAKKVLGLVDPQGKPPGH